MFNFTPHFPTTWQAVVFRNYGMIEPFKIAKVLNTTEDNIINAVQQLGLGGFCYVEDWAKKGYITVIRNNWHLLSNRQIMELLDIDEERFNHILQNEDFLWVKLGKKPELKEPAYTQLTDQELRKTSVIRQVMQSYFEPRQQQYFNFTFNMPQPLPTSNGLRIVHSYSGDFSSQYLSALSACGVNGIWFTQLLSELNQLEYDRLNSLCNLLAGYNIKAFIYLNEPRNMCTSSKQGKEYLYNSVRRLAEAVPCLGGVITICMSENRTNCYSQGVKGVVCKECSRRSPSQVVAEVNNIMHSALVDAGSSARLIAWNWGCNSMMGWSEQEQEQLISLLNSGIDFMCVSEEGLEIEKGGVKNSIIDYSISSAMLSPRSKRLLGISQAEGHKSVVKVQVANSWECACVPYIPAFGLVHRHLSSLKNVANDYMLGWTLGGAISPNLRLANACLNGQSLEQFLQYEYGEVAEVVARASKCFDSAFEQFPFCLSFVYNGSQNFGCANLFYASPTNQPSTMVGFSFDDIDTWRGNYPREVLLGQLKLLSEGWQRGLTILQEADGSKIAELRQVAGAVGCCFNSAYNLTAWIMSRDKGYLRSEFDNTVNMLGYSRKNAQIGFEASNHYLFTDNNLLEKLVNLHHLLQGSN